MEYENSNISFNNDLVCPTCSRTYPFGMENCPFDNTSLSDTNKDSFIGQVFADRYEIIDLIGSGGMSKVYKARQKYIEKEVAIKILNMAAASDANSFDRFVREAKTASLLKHPNIVEIYDFGVSQNAIAFLIMEYLVGDSLLELINRNGFLPIGLFLSIFSQICAGMEHAHNKSIIHRDLKPSNVLILNNTESPNVKIFDFGIAKFIDYDKSNSPELTQKGDVFGSPLYMSPEQCKGEKLTPSSDIYSLGCVMFESLTGVPPFQGTSSYDIMSKHVGDLCPTVSTVSPYLIIPSDLELLIASMLAKNINDRPKSMADIKDVLLAIEKNYSPNDKTITNKPNTATKIAINHNSNQPVQNNIVQPVPVDSNKIKNKVLNESLLKLEKQNKILIGSVISIFIVLFLILNWSGSVNNEVPLYKKLWWDAVMSLGDVAESSKNYDLAKFLYLNAGNLANSFADSSNRKINSLVALRQLYRKTSPDSKAVDELRQLILQANLERVEALYGNLGEDVSTVINLNNNLMPKHPSAAMARAYSDHLIIDAKNSLKKGMTLTAVSFLGEAMQMEKFIPESSKAAILNLSYEIAKHCQAKNQIHESIPIFERALAICNFKNKDEVEPGINLLIYLAKYFLDNNELSLAKAKSKQAIELCQNLDERNQLVLASHKLYTKVLEKIDSKN